MAQKQKEEYISEKNITLVRDLNSLPTLAPEQIKAARALLGWSQADLAKKSGYSLPAINNIERGIASARTDTISDIQQTFELSGVQFIDGPGVRIENAFFRVKVLEGASTLLQLLRNIIHVMDKEGGELLLCGIDENKLLQIGKSDVAAFQQKITKNQSIRVKTLCYPKQDAGITFVGGEKRLANVKGLPLMPSIIYKDRLAYLFFETPFRIMIITHEQTAETARKQFDFIWNNL